MVASLARRASRARRRRGPGDARLILPFLPPPSAPMWGPLPQKKYSVIYADPNWTFETYSEKGELKSPQQHYRCSSIDDICALPVSDVAADDAYLFLWVTWPIIFKTERVINAWGFEFSGLAWEWIKYNPLTGKFAFGGGYGTRKNLEPCLLAKRGNPGLPKSRSERDFILSGPDADYRYDASDPDVEVLVAPRREHSRKPDEAYARIERMFDGPKIELFARHQRAGWDAWGNEVGKF